jgi:hypothetical protein
MTRQIEPVPDTQGQLAVAQPPSPKAVPSEFSPRKAAPPVFYRPAETTVALKITAG